MSKIFGLYRLAVFERNINGFCATS